MMRQPGEKIQLSLLYSLIFTINQCTCLLVLLSEIAGDEELILSKGVFLCNALWRWRWPSRAEDTYDALLISPSLPDLAY